MWVKEVIIDGFKSYANRTVISGWDPAFNAITGLNGTGKSNILDSICFVLGISNLSQVRAGALRDLVYKQGNSHVKKASVTIVFDNRDTKRSPVGYEQYDEITVTRQVVIQGRNKYLINGVTAQLGRVQNLFHSVQLNVNNPHFLIMQGRITKVINMKPPEILGMIEEAAGTRMYETKKKAALKTIAKKQTKVDETNKLLKEEITPTLEKLRQERSTLMKWSANNTEIERLDRFCIAARFLKAQNLVNRSDGDVSALEGKKDALQERTADIADEMKTLDEEVQEIIVKREEDMKTQFQGLENGAAERSKDLVKFTSVWQHKKENLKSEEEGLKDIVKGNKEIKVAMNKKNKEADTAQAKADRMREEERTITERVASLQGQLLGIGMGGNKDDQGGVAQQLMEAQRQCAELEADAKQAASRSKHLTSQINGKKKEAKKAEKDFASTRKGLEKKEAQLKVVEEKLSKANFEPAVKEQVEKKIAELERTVGPLQDRVDRLRARLAHRVDFDFKSPSSGFDRNKVKGLVIKLMEVKDSKASMALEVTAGGRLFNVVVDNEQTGKALLTKGKLKRRVTIIPLNKIARRSLDPKVVATAKGLVGKENVQTALSLVGYDTEVEAAMEYVFGSSFVCKDAKTAEKVTFNQAIKKRSVTLQGDVFDPRGTLTGGSAPNSGSVLMQLQEMNDVEAKLTSGLKQLKQLKKEHVELARAEEMAEDLISSKDLLSHELGLLRERAKESTFSQLTEEVNEMQTALDATVKASDEAKTELKNQQKKVKELEASIKDFESQRKNKIKEIEAEVKASKKKVTAANKDMTKAQQEVDRCQMELKEMEKDVASFDAQKTDAEARIAALKIEVEEAATVMKDAKNSYDDAKALLDAEKDKMAKAEQQIQQLKKRKSRLSKQLSDKEIEMKKLAHKITRLRTDREDAQKHVAVMLKKHDWIASEQQFFGKANTDYDFEATKPKAAGLRLSALQVEQEELGKKINKKVMGMFEKAEQEYQDLMKKRDVIEKDKKKIEEVIIELDRKKNEALETCYSKVTKDFGSIFSALLPGTMAKLEPPEGSSVLDGLEIKVAFGEVWKDSLSELSGGQRSLLALSLILSLLLFKPAPMYILDEIDAALDLSHTQNIGQMLKTHFPQSQFIVVSLKEGMFNNANVLFRTKFVEGVSAVMRTNNKQKNRA